MKSRIRWNGPRGRTFRDQIRISFFQDTFPPHVPRAHPHVRIAADRVTHVARTQPCRATIIKKMEGEGSLLKRPTNRGTDSPSNPSAILDPIIFQGNPRLSPSLSCPIPLSLSRAVSSLGPVSPRRSPLLAATIISVRSMERGHTCRCTYRTTEGERGSSPAEFPLGKVKYFHCTMALGRSPPFVARNPRNESRDIEKRPGAR